MRTSHRTLSPVAFWLLGVFVALVTILGHGDVVLAQDEDPVEDPVNDPEVDETEALLARYVNAPPFPESTLIPRWRIFREESDGSEAADRAFDLLVTTTYELGVTDLPAYSLVLLQESRLALADGDAQGADVLVERATVLSPHSASMQFARAQREWQAQPLAVMSWGRPLYDGYVALWGTVAGRASLEVLWRVTLLRILGLLSLMAAAGFFIRHVGQASFDLRLLSKRLLTLGQARLVVLTLAVAPAVILFSPVLLLITVMVIVAPYLTWSERLVSLALAAAFVFAPTLATDAASARTIEQSMGQYVTTAMTSPCDHRCQARLEVAAERDTETARLALGWVLYRQDGTRHADAVRAVAPVDGDTPGVRSSAHVLLGNLAFIEEDLDAATEHYEAALTHAQTPAQTAAANFNLYRVQERRGDAAAAQPFLLAATRTGLEIVDRFRTYPGRNQNRLLMHSPLPTGEAYASELASVDPAVASLVLDEAASPWFGEVSTTLAQQLLFGLLGLLVAGAALYHRQLAAGRCRDCATPTSRIVFESAHKMGLCVMCYQLRSHTGQLTYHQRLAREKRVERWRNLSPRLKLFANIVFPGLGFTTGGWTLVGLGFGVLVAIGASLISIDVTQLALPYSLSDEHLFYGVRTTGAVLVGFSWISCSIAAFLAVREETS